MPGQDEGGRSLKAPGGSTGGLEFHRSLSFKGFVSAQGGRSPKAVRRRSRRRSEPGGGVRLGGRSPSRRRGGGGMALLGAKIVLVHIRKV